MRDLVLHSKVLQYYYLIVWIFGPKSFDFFWNEGVIKRGLFSTLKMVDPSEYLLRSFTLNAPLVTKSANLMLSRYIVSMISRKFPNFRDHDFTTTHRKMFWLAAGEDCMNLSSLCDIAFAATLSLRMYMFV